MNCFSKHKTAILIFARSSKEEVAHKSIYNGGQLFDSFTNKVLKTAGKTQLPYFHFSEDEQIGNTFGERFANAIEEVFEKGYQRIITIGNDTPQLKASHIAEAEKQLLSNKLVLGPSVDGGFYLMGLHKSQFDKDVFLKLAWQTSEISRELLKHINKERAEVFKLSTFIDIDTQADVRSIISYTCGFSKEMLIAILSALNSPVNGDFTPLQQFQPFPLGVGHNKGSPKFLSF